MSFIVVRPLGRGAHSAQNCCPCSFCSHKQRCLTIQIEQADRNQLFRLIDRLFTTPSTKLPIHESLDQLVQEFNDFFYQQDSRYKNGYYGIFDLSAPSDTVVRQEVITSLSNKTCFLDPISTLVVKDNIDSVLPVLSEIVRRSLITQGMFPTILKESHVHPRLKNFKLESDSLSSYRPVANISFLNKVTEKFAITQR